MISIRHTATVLALGFFAVVTAPRYTEPVAAQTSSCPGSGGDLCQAVQTCTLWNQATAQCAQWVWKYYYYPESGSGCIYTSGAKACPEDPE